MKIYYHGNSSLHRIFVTPAVDHPEVAAWRELDGRPRQFEVLFQNGLAIVDDNLGKYLVEKGLASKTKVIADHREVA